MKHFRFIPFMLILSMSMVMKAHTIHGCVWDTNDTEAVSQSSTYGDLLCSGQYTNTGIVRSGPNFTNTGNVSLSKISVYEKVAFFEDDNPLYYSGDFKVYEETGRKYASNSNNNLFLFLTNNGLIRVVLVISNTFPYVGTVTETRVNYFEEGDTRYKYVGAAAGQNNGVINNNYGNSNNYNNNARKPVCKTCMGMKLCRNCNGSKLVANPYTRRNEFCEVCNRTGKCPTCNGTGESPFRR